MSSPSLTARSYLSTSPFSHTHLSKWWMLFGRFRSIFVDQLLTPGPFRYRCDGCYMSQLLLQHSLPSNEPSCRVRYCFSLELRLRAVSSHWKWLKQWEREFGPCIMENSPYILPSWLVSPLLSKVTSRFRFEHHQEFRSRKEKASTSLHLLDLYSA